jgi:Rps23 Pro-64 3,4-dihydroxylase Tpa1-like proline 4-hydroxylase
MGMSAPGSSSRITELVNPEVLNGTAALADRFAAARPFPHVVIDRFLSGPFCAEICSQFPSFEDAAAINEDGRVGGKATQEQVRSLGQAFESLDKLVQSTDFVRFIEQITGIEGLSYDPWYFGGGTHESLHGQDLDAHIDFNYHPITREHRRLNLIIYLNEEWDDRWGGSLQLHRDPSLPPADDEIVTVTPLMNRCVMFETSERSWHGFEKIQLPPGKQHLSRRSFAIYYYSADRPAAETADEHSTVYVERHLPERFVAGRTLDEADVEELKGLLARRDEHLQRLYRQVQEANGRLTNSWLISTEMLLRRRVYELEHSTSWRITAPLRALKRLLGRGPGGGAGGSSEHD